MPRRQDLTNQQFGEITVIGYSHSVRGRPFWLCRCSCGTEKLIRSNNLLTGATRSCGCLGSIGHTNVDNSLLNEHGQRIYDLTGHVSGQLTVISYSHSNNGGRTYWFCQCSCGKQKTLRADGLKSSNIQSCGCARSVGRQNKSKTLLNEHGVYIKDLTGQTFGQLTVISYDRTDPKRGSCWLMRCTCNNEKVMPASLFRGKGRSKSCGCLMGSAVDADTNFVVNPISKRRINDISGQKFGKLKVVKYSHSIRRRHFWLCHCECGTPTTADGASLRTGNTTSCGCAKGVSRRLDVTGQRFGRLVVLGVDEAKSSKNIRTFRVCQCDCGKIVSVVLDLLTSGHTRSCGCLHQEIRSEIGSRIGIHNTKATSRYNWHVFQNDERITLRSGFEVIFAEYLLRNNIRFEYEPQLFVLKPNIRYRPDFYLPDSETWVEVKGYATSRWLEKKQLFEQITGHPLIVVDQESLLDYLPGTTYQAWMKRNASKYLRVQ